MKKIIVLLFILLINNLSICNYKILKPHEEWWEKKPG